LPTLHYTPTFTGLLRIVEEEDRGIYHPKGKRFLATKYTSETGLIGEGSGPGNKELG